MWDFVVPEDEVPEQIQSRDAVAFRPNRMALGCSSEMIQEKISENAKKSRLEKLLKRRAEEEDEGLSKSVRKEADLSDSEFSKSKVVSKSLDHKEQLSSVVVDVPVEKILSKSQKKRQKHKFKQMQKSLLV